MDYITDPRYSFDNFVAGKKIIRQAENDLRDGVLGLVGMLDGPAKRQATRGHVGQMPWYRFLLAYDTDGVRDMSYDGVNFFFRGQGFIAPQVEFLLQVQGDMDGFFRRILAEFSALCPSVDPFINAAAPIE